MIKQQPFISTSNSDLTKNESCQQEMLTLSIIVPVYNEELNISLACDEILTALKKTGYAFEIIIVNDGSTDKTGIIIDELATKNRYLRIIHFCRNFGQTAAMMAGIDYASGDIIVPMDGDLQNDPDDIPALVNKIKEGYDVCSGWRKLRKDNPIKRTLPSKIANRLISFISGVKLNDYGCSLKAYKKDFIKGVRLYGEMHRFIPIYASWLGAKVTEIEVNHRPRVHGYSKYGLKRSVKVLLDLLVVKFFATYLQKPIYVFGGFGLFNFGCAFLTFVSMLYYKFWGDKSFIQTPLPIIFSLFIIMGFMSILIGLIAELLMRTYYESQHKSVYLITSTHNLEQHI